MIFPILPRRYKAKKVCGNLSIITPYELFINLFMLDLWTHCDRLLA